MKELKDICIDLEYAKKLKELGVKQDSLFYSECNFHKNEVFTKEEVDKKVMAIDGNCGNSYEVSLFTATELLELLPEYVEVNKLQNAYSVDNDFGDNKIHCKGDKKLPNALAKMLIYLIENKLMEVTK